MSMKRATPPDTPNVVDGTAEGEDPDSEVIRTGRITLRLPPELAARSQELGERIDKFRERGVSYEPEVTIQKQWVVQPWLHEYVKAEAEKAGMTINAFVQRLLRDPTLAPMPRAKITWVQSEPGAVANAEPVDLTDFVKGFSSVGIVSKEEAAEELSIPTGPISMMSNPPDYMISSGRAPAFQAIPVKDPWGTEWEMSFDVGAYTTCLLLDDRVEMPRGLTAGTFLVRLPPRHIPGALPRFGVTYAGSHKFIHVPDDAPIELVTTTQPPQRAVVRVKHMFIMAWTEWANNDVTVPKIKIF